MTAETKSLLLEALQEEFERETDELLAIACESGDSRQEAIEWVTDDLEVQWLLDTIEHIRCRPLSTATRAELRTRRVKAQQAADRRHQDALIAECNRQFKERTKKHAD